MLKNFTLLTAACLLTITGCTISIGGGTDSASDTASSSSDGSAGSTSAGGSTSGSTGGASDSVGSTSSSPTSTTSPTTTASSTTEPATSTSAGSTSGGSNYGMCGWSEQGYYACAPDGVPGEADPMGTFPIDCPDPLPVAGDKCDEMGPVTGQGCCLPDGTNYYCDNNGSVVIEACGA